MSSFKRTAKAGSSAGAQNASGFTQSESEVTTGVKPSVSTGLGIVSSGNKQLDDLIGGGIALGTIVFVESDGFSGYADTFLLYDVAESISHKHPVLVVAEDNTEAERIMTSLPYNQTISTAGYIETTPLEAPAENKLTIAWQYSKYLKTAGTLCG